MVIVIAFPCIECDLNITGCDGDSDSIPMH